jgi:hypothetical protein
MQGTLSKKLMSWQMSEAEREAKVVIGPEAFFSAKRTFCSQPAPKFVDGFCKVQKIMVLMRLRPT